MLDAGFLLVIESLWVGWCIVCLLCMKSVGGWVLLCGWLMYSMYVILICSYWLVLYPEIYLQIWIFGTNKLIDWLIDMKSSVFWDIIPCSPLKVKQRFRGTWHVHLQDWEIALLAACLMLVSCLAYLQHWRWRQNVPLKHWFTFNGLHSIIFQKIEFFISSAFLNTLLTNVITKAWFAEIPPSPVVVCYSDQLHIDKRLTLLPAEGAILLETPTFDVSTLSLLNLYVFGPWVTVF
jgi:hypothetical protein